MRFKSHHHSPAHSHSLTSKTKATIEIIEGELGITSNTWSSGAQVVDLLALREEG